jgi:hypothetical protein
MRMRLRHSHSRFSLHSHHLVDLGQILGVSDGGLVALPLIIGVIVLIIAIARVSTGGGAGAHTARGSWLVVKGLKLLLLLLLLLLDIDTVGNNSLPGAHPDAPPMRRMHLLASLTDFNAAEIAVKVVATVAVDLIEIVICLVGFHDL